MGRCEPPPPAAPAALKHTGIQDIFQFDHVLPMDPVRICYFDPRAVPQSFGRYWAERHPMRLWASNTSPDEHQCF